MLFNKEIRKVLSVAVLFHVATLVACQGKVDEVVESPSITVSSDKPSTVVGAVQGVIVEVGNGLVSDGSSQSVQGKIQAQNVNALCNEHAMPLDEQGGYMDSQGPDYPSRLFYCKLAQNSGSPDSIPGSFQQIKAISCMLEKVGIVYDDQERQVSVTPDTSCFTAQQLENMQIQAMTISVRASKPAFFNTYYDSGISMTIPGMGFYRVAAKLSGTKMEFLTHEDQTSVQPDKTGTFAASFDLLTGELKYESRGDRFQCTEQGGNCGWSRHERLLAQVGMTNGEITSVSKIEAIAGEIYGDGNWYSARVSTIKGSLANGLKARYFMVNSNTSADLGDATKYSEVVNNRCYTHSSDQADCSANPGIELPQEASFKFNLHPSTQYTSTQAWVSQLTGLSFTGVNFNDVQ
ncbi:hypothetical protein AB1A81_08630 [Bdellovibrio bacteriovorus]|uniref:Lipoprotein n=1 Tax=Bdellovibrio bacteriovorus (strain ATCC 15356 / DSM 50701 / NCIMB 9529 / HD100) TaxID=264462 RepID=Q6MLW1_BDEBA|nr:hypothetical protein [Bdellovibrio bacteriovorus]AHZ84394.1 hypothetical protein EP01_05525 [Bdellovibrio bacteriovorus]BEV68283.1 hypothetical protein Bb109J_c1703 [Bdellovibrio bacteriovorus]CAE79745.1 hypothetical protein predicted by Glimmer/Critica [Bdellovibrio bacteriovorus HD100]